METSALPSEESRPLVRFPTTAVAVGLFVVLFILGDLPFYLQAHAPLSVGVSLPFGLFGALAIVALVVAVIVIDRPVAILIGVAAGTASSVAHHYWTYRDEEFVSNWELPQKPASDVLVDAVLTWGIRLGLVGFAALLAGRYLIPRVTGASTESDQPTVRLPGVKTCLILLGALLLIDVVGTQSPYWPIWREVVGRAVTTATILSFVALFLAVFTIFRRWALLLVPLVFIEQVAVSTIGSGCINNDVEFSSCFEEILGPIWLETLLLMIAYAAIAYPCRIWANRPAVDRHSHSGGDSINSSKLPAGSRT